METTLVTKTLTDGSEVVALVFLDGSYELRIDCFDTEAALELQACLVKNALYGSIY